MTSFMALALAGAVSIYGGCTAQAAHPTSAFREAALVGPATDLGTTSGTRDVIEPPSSVDPGMAIDPPDTGAKMPIVHPRVPDGAIPPR